MKNILVLVVLATTLAWSQQPKQEQVGRYQIVMCNVSSPMMCSRLLDTVTGRTWTFVSAPDGVSFWEPETIMYTPEQEATYLKKHQKDSLPSGYTVEKK
jgi:hypothetical protein